MSMRTTDSLKRRGERGSHFVVLEGGKEQSHFVVLEGGKEQGETVATDSQSVFIIWSEKNPVQWELKAKKM